MSFDGLALTLLAVLAGIFMGLARGGRFRNVVGITVRAKGLLVIGIVVPALADQFTREVAVPLVVGGLAALLAFAIVNVRIVGMSVMAVGIVANLLPTFLNGGLPVSRDALVEAGLATRADVDRVELRGARRLEEPTQRLRFLGDIIPLEATNQVLAFGDLVILVGLADITANLTLRKRRRSGTEASDDAAERDIAVIDLVRLHAPHGTHNPRPHPMVTPDLDEAHVAEQPAAPDELVAGSPDVDWWPVAVHTASAEDDAPYVLEPVAPELVESEPLVDWEELEAEDREELEPADAGAPADVAGLLDEVDEVEVWADVDPELLPDSERPAETELAEQHEGLVETGLVEEHEGLVEAGPVHEQERFTEPELEPPPEHSDLAPADLLDLEPARRPRRIDLDLDLRWAPEPDHIDLRELPEPAWATESAWSDEPQGAQVTSLEPAQATPAELSVAGSVAEVAPRWATAEPQWATDAAPEPEGAGATPATAVAAPNDAAAPAHVRPAAAGDDNDDLFQLLFADLKPRRSRRRGERTIPDFEPVHVDDDTITPRRR
jgi:hypothetical protein